VSGRNQARVKVFCRLSRQGASISIAFRDRNAAEEIMTQTETTSQDVRVIGSAQPGSTQKIDSFIQPHNERSAAVWSSGGEAYDVISRQIGTALEHCVARLSPEPGEKILDLATGTGWTSRLVARRGANVSGADIASELLATATERAGREGLKIEYQIGDAEKLPFADQAFDGVISTFGVMFASRPEAAARELARVCRSGGRIALATWLPDSSVFKMFQVMRPFMPPPPSPAPPSPFEWGNMGRVRALLAADFDLRFEQGVATYFDRDGAATWEAFVTGYRPTKALARSLDDSRRVELKQAFIAFHDSYRTELGITVPREYLIILGKRK
jgi:2-polyprenyl-3-methyl-5-hydroxy-6-metoxy-1,4-benzoquinol methylase